MDSVGKEIVLPDFDFFKPEKKIPTAHSCFLLGAGFSVNQGYPIANDLNKQIQYINPENFTIDSEGNLFNLPESKDDPFWYFSDARKKHFIKELIQLFLQGNMEFDYEDFYDFLTNPNLLKKDEFQEICKNFREKKNGISKENKNEFSDVSLIWQTVRLMNQIIQILLVDKEGKNFYEPSIHQMKPLPFEYNGFLQLLERIGENSVVHIIILIV